MRRSPTTHLGLGIQDLLTDYQDQALVDNSVFNVEQNIELA